MRIAMDLSDGDVVVLRTLLASLGRQSDMQKPQNPNFGRVIPAPVEIRNMTRDEVLSSYAKLESLGLINQATSSWTPQASEAHEIAPSGLTMSTNQWPD